LNKSSQHFPSFAPNLQSREFVLPERESVQAVKLWEIGELIIVDDGLS